MLRCLDKDPAGRYQSAKELAEDLLRLWMKPERVRSWKWPAIAICALAAVLFTSLTGIWRTGNSGKKVLGSPVKLAGTQLSYVSGRRLSAGVPVVESLLTATQREFELPLAQNANPRWTPDGRSIVFRSGAGTTDARIKFVDVQTGAMGPSDKLALDIAWGRDGSMYLLRGKQGLFIRNARSKSGTLLYPFSPGTTAVPDGIRLSPDDRWIALQANQGCRP